MAVEWPDCTAEAKQFVAQSSAASGEKDNQKMEGRCPETTITDHPPTIKTGSREPSN